MLHVLHWVAQVRFERDQQSVVRRPANREQHFILSEIRVDAWEGAGWAGKTASRALAGIETIAGEVRDRCTSTGRMESRAGSDGGVDGGSAAGAQGSRYGRLRIRHIEESRVTDFVCVDTLGELGEINYWNA